MRKFTTIAIAIIAFASCIACSKAKKDATDGVAQTEIAESPRNIPEGAIAFDYGGHLYFDVMLRDSVPATMAFDTGNTSLLLDNLFFQEHFAQSETLIRTVIQGAGNSLEGAYKDTSDWTYRIGEYPHTEQGAIVMDLRKILGDHVDGMFGMEFMRGKKIELNYIDGYMRILPQEEQPAEGYVCLQGKWMNNRQVRMLVPMNIKFNDKLSFDGNFLVDLGASANISINSSCAAKLNLGDVVNDVNIKVYDVGGVGGSRIDYLFKIDNASIANFDIKDLTISSSGNSMGVMADNSYDGLIGNALLEQFDVIFDFERCQMWLRPNKNFNPTAKYDTGMTLTPKTDCWVVNGLIEGGNAHKAGVKRGDIITSINGLSPEKVNIRTLKRLNDSAEDWRIVVKRNNTETTITFKKEQI